VKDETVLGMTDILSVRLQERGIAWPAIPLACAALSLIGWSAVLIDLLITMSRTLTPLNTTSYLIVGLIASIIAQVYGKMGLERIREHRQHLSSDNTDATANWNRIAGRNRLNGRADRFRTRLVVTIGIIINIMIWHTTTAPTALSLIAGLASALVIFGGEMLDHHFAAAPAVPPRRRAQAKLSPA
jgi:hypothetical protein